MAEPAEVRAWAREQGLEVNARGAIPADIIAQYDSWHNDRLPDPDYTDPGDNAGVTEADFPPAPEGDLFIGETAAPPKRERRPRTVKAARPKPGAKGWKQLFGGTQAKVKGKGGPRTDLSEFAEDTWRDLAMLSAGVMPPVSRVLTVQAPYAGVVFDEAVRGLPVVDAVLQPVARASVSLRALNGLLGPSFFTAAICVQGQWEMEADGVTPKFGDDGRMIPTTRTAMMFGGLKYSLLQMSRTADLSKVQERAEVDAERMRAVDQLVDFIFPMPRKAPAPAHAGDHPSPASPPHPGAPGQVLVPTFVYPPPPQMDDVGAMSGSG